MQQVSPRLEHWPSVVGHISSLMDLDASARANKALLRKRGVRSAADLLHLALLYGPGGLSLHSVGSFATEATIAEALCCMAVRPGDVLVQDRGYARLRNFAHAKAQGADFITRIGWRSVNLFDPADQRFDLIAALSESAPPVAEHAVGIGTGHSAVAARLIIARKPAEAIDRQHKRLRRKAQG